MCNSLVLIILIEIQLFILLNLLYSFKGLFMLNSFGYTVCLLDVTPVKVRGGVTVSLGPHGKVEGFLGSVELNPSTSFH